MGKPARIRLAAHAEVLLRAAALMVLKKNLMKATG